MVLRRPGALSPLHSRLSGACDRHVQVLQGNHGPFAHSWQARPHSGDHFRASLPVQATQVILYSLDSDGLPGIPAEV
jgi:hypothetical protein